MFFLALLLTLCLWWPLQWLVVPQLPVFAEWPVPLQSGTLYTILLAISWLFLRVIAFTAAGASPVLQRVLRIEGTRAVSLLMAVAASVGLLLWVFGAEMASWYSATLIPLLVTGWCNLLGVEIVTGFSVSGGHGVLRRAASHSPGVTAGSGPSLPGGGGRTKRA